MASAIWILNKIIKPLTLRLSNVLIIYLSNEKRIDSC